MTTLFSSGELGARLGKATPEAKALARRAGHRPQMVGGALVWALTDDDLVALRLVDGSDRDVDLNGVAIVR